MANLSVGGTSAFLVAFRAGSGRPSRHTIRGMKKPLRALAVAEDAPAGVMTGRVGAGLNGPGLPRDEARFSS